MYLFVFLISFVLTLICMIFYIKMRDKQVLNKINGCLQPLGRQAKNMMEAVQAVDEIASRQNREMSTLMDWTNDMMQISGKLSYHAEEFNIAMKEIAEGANNMAAGAYEQSQNASYIETHMVNIYNKSEQNLKNCEMTQRISQSSYGRIIDRKKNIEGIINEFDEAISKIHSVDASIKQLKDSYKDIGAMITGIKHISSQTNLLALNASIEAARAGEHGKGFAVVALEVKKLAEESSQVVEKIIGLIKQTHLDTDNTGMLMNDTAKHLSEQYIKLKSSVEDLGDIENNISLVVKDIDKLIENDRALVEEYERVSNRINDLSTIAESNKHQVASVSESIKDEANSVGSILSISEKLEVLSKSLFKYISDLEKKDENTLVVAVSEYPPFLVEHSLEGSFSGIDYDIMQEVFARKGIKAIYKSYPFEKTLELIKEGFIDVIPTLSYKREREEYMIFTNSYRDTTKYVFVTKEDSQKAINSASDIEKYNIGIVKGFSYPEEFIQNIRIQKDESISPEIMLTKLIKNQIDAAILNEFTLGDYIAKNNLKGKIKRMDYAIVDKTSDTRLAFAKVNNLQNSKKLFDEGFEEIKKDGTLEKIYNRYSEVN